MRRNYKLILLLLACFPFTSEAQNINGDYTNSGISELAVATVYRTSEPATEWVVRKSTGTFRFYQFDVAADALVVGRYYFDQNLYPGVVRVITLGESLEWRIKNENAEENVLRFGLPGDDIPNQGDLDCDGRTDIIIVRNIGNFKHWYVAQTSGGIVQKLFGLKDDKVFTGDMNGDGCDELIVLRDGFTWFSTKLYGEQVTQIQWGLWGDYPLVPRDMNGNGTADYIVSRVVGDQQVVFTRISNARFEVKAFDVSPDAIPFVGRFSGQNRMAFWDRETGIFTIEQRNGTKTVAYGDSLNTFIRPDGTVVQPDESGRFGDTGTGGGTGGGGDGGGNSGVCSHPSFPDGSGGRLWKPVKEGGTHTPGGPTYLASNSIVRLEIYGASGALVNTPRLRYYNGNGGRSVWDPTLTASQLSVYKPITLREHYGNGSCAEVVVPNPTSRVD